MTVARPSSVCHVVAGLRVVSVGAAPPVVVGAIRSSWVGRARARWSPSGSGAAAPGVPLP